MLLYDYTVMFEGDWFTPRRRRVSEASDAGAGVSRLNTREAECFGSEHYLTETHHGTRFLRNLDTLATSDTAEPFDCLSLIVAKQNSFRLDKASMMLVLPDIADSWSDCEDKKRILRRIVWGAMFGDVVIVKEV